MIGDLNIVIPDVPEPIVAYRVWSVDDGWLSSTSFTAVADYDPNAAATLTWPVGEPLVAECRTDVFKYGNEDRDACGHTPSPNRDGHCGSGCGIYAYRTADGMFAAHPAQAEVFIFGEVLLSGEVYEHELGYRAHRARVHAIYDTHDAARGIAALYNVPLVKIDIEHARTLWLDKVSRAGYAVGGVRLPLALTTTNWTPLPALPPRVHPVTAMSLPYAPARRRWPRTLGALALLIIVAVRRLRRG